MAQSFSKLIKLSDRLHEFNFRRMPGKDPRYHVDVPDNRGNRIIFYMHKDEKDGWKTSGELPEWVQKAESALAEVIQQQEEEKHKPFTTRRKA